MPAYPNIDILNPCTNTIRQKAPASIQIHGPVLHRGCGQPGELRWSKATHLCWNTDRLDRLAFVKDDMFLGVRTCTFVPALSVGRALLLLGPVVRRTPDLQLFGSELVCAYPILNNSHYPLPRFHLYLVLSILSKDIKPYT